jgi:hypothetical protein
MNICSLSYRLVETDDFLYSQSLCREAIPWRQLNHPNVLPFLGIDEATSLHGACLVLPWVPFGDILNYVKTNPVSFSDVHGLVKHSATNSVLALTTPPFTDAGGCSGTRLRTLPGSHTRRPTRGSDMHPCS